MFLEISFILLDINSGDDRYMLISFSIPAFYVLIFYLRNYGEEFYLRCHRCTALLIRSNVSTRL